MADRRMQANIQWFAPRPSRLVRAVIIVLAVAALIALGASK
jgi:hypothetical protein